MDVTLQSYRDDANEIVDDIQVKNSVIKRAVILRNGDGSITVRGKTDDSQFEERFSVSNRQYVGLVPQKNQEIRDIRTELKDLLSVVGYTIEPSHINILGENE